MSHPMAFWADYRAAYEARDWNECAVRLGRFVDAHPFHMSARQALAWLSLRLDQPRAALVHYDKLVPLAVGSGDLFRVIAVQRRMDEIAPTSTAELRYAAIQRWFRLLGLPALASLPSTNGHGLSAVAMLRLSPEAFAHAVRKAAIGSFDVPGSTEVATGGDQWNVVWGTTRWRLVARNGRVMGEGQLDEGGSIRSDRTRFKHGQLLFSPDTPGEWLRFDADLLVQLQSLDPRIGHDPLFDSEIIREDRVVLPSRPQAPSDLDHRMRPSASRSAAPPRLDLGFERLDAPRDSGEWVEFGQLDLGATGSAEAGGADSGPPDDEVHAPNPPLTLHDVPATSHPAAAAEDASGANRRERRRVLVRFSAKLSLLGLADAPETILAADVIDLSIGGVRLGFPKSDLQRALAMVENETLKLEVLAPSGATLHVAGRVRWLDFGQSDHVTAGIQFLLLTERDRETLARLVIDADPGIRAAREAARRAEGEARARVGRSLRSRLDSGSPAA